MEISSTILLSLEAERKYQEEEWGSEHDSDHSPVEWSRFIRSYCDKLHDVLGDKAGAIALVKIAALAIAALEQYEDIPTKICPTRYLEY